jgi:hypothetical protein
MQFGLHFAAINHFLWTAGNEVVRIPMLAKSFER